MLQMINELKKLDAPKKIRIKFSKKGNLIFISHLDLNRTFTRAIVRARIPVKYTEGFNPRPKLIFSTPLSVGCSSECEFLDLKIDREISTEQIKEQLSLQMPDGLQIIDVYEPSTKFTDIIYSEYKIVIDDMSIDEYSAGKIDRIFSQSELKIIKRSKSGDKQTDILPYIRNIDYTSEKGRLCVSAVLCVSSADFLNPEYIVSVIYDALGLSKENYMLGQGYSIVRRSLLISDSKTMFK